MPVKRGKHGINTAFVEDTITFLQNNTKIKIAQYVSFFAISYMYNREKHDTIKVWKYAESRQNIDEGRSFL